MIYSGPLGKHSCRVIEYFEVGLLDTVKSLPLFLLVVLTDVSLLCVLGK